jgi:hypothetical protein
VLEQTIFWIQKFNLPENLTTRMVQILRKPTEIKFPSLGVFLAGDKMRTCSPDLTFDGRSRTRMEGAGKRGEERRGGR